MLPPKSLFRFLLITACWFYLFSVAKAQTNQTVSNGTTTSPINFPGSGCVYSWVNNTPGIGLPASGTGNIPSFTATNAGNSPIIATITATPVPQGFAYVAGSGGSVSVINLATNKVASIIPTGKIPWGVSVNPARTMVYVSNLGSNTVSVISTATNAVVATIPVGLGPFGVVVSPDGTRVYAANESSNTVSVISTATNAVVATIPVGSSPSGVSVSPDGTTLYVANQGASTVSVISTATNTVTSTIVLDSGPYAIAVSQDGSRLYVSGYSGNDVFVINTSTNTIITKIPVQKLSAPVILSPDGSTVYVANDNPSTISVINTTTNTVTTTISTPGGAAGLSETPDGNFLYVVNEVASTVSVINTITNTIVATINTSSSGISLGNFIDEAPTTGCAPLQFTITVNPSPPPVITANTATGAISTCAGTASASPDIQQFTVSGSNLTGNISATAPPNFEVSLTPGSGYGSSVTLTQSGGSLSSTIMYVRSAASGAPGSISGNVVLSSAGATSQNVAVSGVINALPTVTQPANQTVINGSATTTVNFTGTANTFTWVNDTPGIGLPANGAGNIASFTAVNTGSTPVTATITATPYSAGYAYVANNGAVSAISTLTNTIVSTIAVGKNPVGVSVSPDNSKVYVSNFVSNSVSVISTATNSVIATIPVGTAPYEIAAIPNGKEVFVVNSGSKNISVISTATNAVTATIPVSSTPLSLAVSPDGSIVYVTTAGANSISVISTVTNTVVNTIATTQPGGIAISLDGSRLYVVSTYPKTLSVINTITYATIATIKLQTDPVGPLITPIGIAVSPDGSRVYVVDYISNDVEVVNAITNTLAAIIPVGTGPISVAVSPDNSRIYVTNQTPSSVSVVNASTSTIIATVAVPGDPVSYGNFVSSGTGCTGVPVKFSITVNPTPAIVTSTATGTISACAGTASASPQVEQFTVSGSNLTGNITATAPAGFEVSLAAGSGYGSSVTLTQSGGVIANATVYVRSSASAAAGTISGNVILTSAGAPIQKVPVTGVINPLATVTQPANQVVNNGQNTTAINFTGTANTYSWTNDTQYIGLGASGTVNIASFKAVNTGNTPVKATVTVTPVDNGYIYVTNESGNTVSVINATDNSLVSGIQTDSQPYETALSADGSTLYVSCVTANSVDVINTATNKVIASIPVDSRPTGITLSPDGSKLYVANTASNTITVINTANNTPVSNIRNVNVNPVGVAVSPDGSTLFVSDESSNYVTVINAATGSIITKITVGQYSIGMVSNTDGSLLYVAVTNNNTISVIKTADNTVQTTIPLRGVSHLLLSNDGSEIYATSPFLSQITIISTSTNTITGTISTGKTGYNDLAESSDGDFLYVTNGTTNTVEVISLQNNSDVSSISVGSEPYAVAYKKPAACTGIPVSFTITVNPDVTPTLTATGVKGSISTCQGSASAYPDIEGFDISGNSLQANIMATAPMGFEVSPNENTGYAASISIPESSGSVTGVTVYVRASASAPAGNISGNIVLTSAGAPMQSVRVTGIVNPLATVTQPANQVVPTGQSTTPVNFSGTGNTFTWTNDTPSIGLPSSGTGNIASFIAVNTGTAAVKATIMVTPKTDPYVYVSNNANSSVSVIDVVTNTVVTNIQTDANPYDMALSPDRTMLYVSCSAANYVDIISTATNTVVKQIPTGNQPWGMALSADGSRLYVANLLDNSISVINTVSNTVINTIGNVVTGPFRLALIPDGSKLFVSDQTSNDVSVINTATGLIVTKIPVANNPAAVISNSDGSILYVASVSANVVSVIQTSDNTVITTIPFNYASNLLLSNDGSKVYVSSPGSAGIGIISTATNAITGYVYAQEGCNEMAESDDGSYLYSPTDDRLETFDLSTNYGVSEVGVGAYPFGVVYRGAAACAGMPVSFNITVKPNAIDSISATSATGNILACQGNPSASPDIQSFTVSGSSLQAAITATAPAGFEVSLDENTGYAGSIPIPQTGGTVANLTVYVRSSVSAPVGDISGNVTLTSTGATAQTVAVTGTISTPPTVNQPANQTVTNGSATATVNFTGGANGFTWTNDTPGIGLAASGTGDISSFTAINTGNTPVTATITVTPEKSGFAYITTNDGQIALLNTLTNTITNTFNPGNGVQAITLSPDGGTIYTANFKTNAVEVISAASGRLIATVPTGTTPIRIVISPDGKYIYTTNEGSGNVTVISTATNTVMATILTGQSPEGLAISPDGTKLYVGDGSTRSVYVVNTATNTVSATIPVPNYPDNDIAITPNGNFIYVVNQSTATVTVINTATNTITTTIPVGSDPQTITMSPDGSKAYVCNDAANYITVISTATNTVTAQLPSQIGDLEINVSADGSTLYVINDQIDAVMVVNASTGTQEAIIADADIPISLGNFLTNASACEGAPVKFTITVNPTSAAQHNTGGVTGYISACIGNASASPNIEQFPVSGSNLIGSITVAAPANFEVSLNPNTGYNAIVTIPETGGSVTNVPVYVRSAASDAVGKISGNVVLSSPGATDGYIAVTGVVNALPSVTVQPPSQELASGATTQPINFTGPANTFTWTNNTPSIGLPAGGTGNIPAFTAINTMSSKVTATLTVVPQLIGYAYITNQQGNTVSVINTATNIVVKTIPVGQTPTGAAVSPDGTKVYITNQRSNTISVISTLTNQVVSTIQLTNVSSPTGIAVSPDGQSLYVVNLGSNSVSVINSASGNITSTFAVGGYPVGTVVSPDGSNVFVTNSSNNISDINITKGNVTTIPVAKGPYDVCISPDGSTLYVTNSGGNAVSVINAASGVVTAAIPVGTNPEGLAISADGSTLYVVNETSGNVSVINIATNKVISTIAVGSQPVGVSLTADGGFVYVTNQGSNSVSVISTASNSVVASIPVGAGPESLGNFILAGSGCSGTPITFTITVDPAPLTPSITATTAADYISACVGNASASPGIQQFTVSGSNLTGNITATAPANFEVSLAAGSGYGSSVTIDQSGGAVNNNIVYVRSSASAPVGTISGNITLTSAGAVTQTVAVTGIVKALVIVNPVLSQTVVNGNITAPITFTGTGNAFTWVNTTPGIGLPASGMGNIPLFTAVNNTSTSVTATVTVTPLSAGFAYITNYNSNTVSVINTISNTVAAIIPVGTSPVSVSVSPDDNYVYVLNVVSNSVSVISTATNTVVATINNVGLFPIAIAASTDGSSVYVANTGAGASVSVINAKTNKVTANIVLNGDPTYMWGSPDGSKIYVSNKTSGYIWVISTATNSIIAKITVGSGPGQIVTSSDGNFVYVVNTGSNSVSVINALNNTVIATIPVAPSPVGISTSTDGSYLYTSNSTSESVSVISTATNTVTSTISTSTGLDGISGGGPWAISVNPDNGMLYVTIVNSNAVFEINPNTNTVVSAIQVGMTPFSLGNFITKSTGCSGVPVSFQITVNPTGSPAMNTESVTGNIVACQGTSSAGPNIEQFQVSGSSLSGNITITAPADFEVSFDPVTGYGKNVIITEVGGNVTNVPIYVRSAASDAAGNISGNIVLSSPGVPDDSVAVTGVIYALPMVNKVGNQTVNNGAATAAVNFTGTGSAYDWTNDMPSIGLQASGTGDIPAFTPINTTNTTVIAKITVVPMPVISDTLGCSGVPITFTITIEPSANNIAQTLVIPNTFTPNGDGINDTWVIKSLENYPNCTVEIYNRWGEKLYSSIGYAIPWDGTYKGANLPVGTYYYIINLKNGVNAISGWVAIIK